MQLAHPGGSALDLAAGHGRHARVLASAGLAVVAVDRASEALADLRAIGGVEVLEADLEGGPWPFAGRAFDVIVVANYLWRPLLPRLADTLGPGGLLIYETFGVGNELHGKPSNPEFLLQPGELLALALQADLEVIAYESGFTAHPKPAVVQRICARRGSPGPGPGPGLLERPAQ